MDAHAREAAAAEAAIAEFYGTVWHPRPGDRVRVELPFVGEYGIGTVLEVNSTRVVVDVDGESLWYYEHELERVGGEGEVTS
jgi:FKBP-type peptidyl-prolyl cis-trans isomerase 2